MPATFNDGLVKGKDTSTALQKASIVTYDTTDTTGETVQQANTGTDTTPPIGISKFSVTTAEIAQGKGASVVMDGRAIVLVGVADLAVGTPVTSDANGAAIAATDGDWLLGVVDEPGPAAGYCTVNLVDSGTKYSA